MMGSGREGTRFPRIAVLQDNSQSKNDIPHELGQVTNAKACMSKKPLSLVQVKYEYKKISVVAYFLEQSKISLSLVRVEYKYTKSQSSHISWNSQRNLYL